MPPPSPVGQQVRCWRDGKLGSSLINVSLFVHTFASSPANPSTRSGASEPAEGNRVASAASTVRLRISSFWKIWWRCTLIVPSTIFSRRPISLFDNPSETRRMISRSMPRSCGPRLQSAFQNECAKHGYCSLRQKVRRWRELRGVSAVTTSLVFADSLCLGGADWSESGSGDNAPSSATFPLSSSIVARATCFKWFMRCRKFASRLRVWRLSTPGGRLSDVNWRSKASSSANSCRHSSASLTGIPCQFLIIPACPQVNICEWPGVSSGAVLHAGTAPFSAVVHRGTHCVH